MSGVAKFLAQAKNAAGAEAVLAAGRHEYAKSREWQALAVEIDRVFRDAIVALASPASDALKEDER